MLSEVFSNKKKTLIVVSIAFVVLFAIFSVRKCTPDMPKKQNEQKEKEILTENEKIDSSISNIVVDSKIEIKSYENKILNNKNKANNEIKYYRDAPFDSALSNISRTISKDSI